MGWEKEGVNYWENDDCPDEYLRVSLAELLKYVEGVDVNPDEFIGLSRVNLCERVGVYEYMADK